jgi:hypothetical protein
MRNVRNISVLKQEGKIQIGRRRCRWKDNIKIDIKFLEYEGVGWIRVAQDGCYWQALVNTAMDIRVP